RIGIVDVVVGKLLALNLFGGRHAEPFLARDIERCFLMGILSVTQRLAELSAERTPPRRFLVAILRQFARQPAGDFGVVSGGAGVSDLGQLAAMLKRRCALVSV